MTKHIPMPFEHAQAICYSGYRDGQSPETGAFPTYDEIHSDLLLLQNDWKYLRLYDCDKHAEIVLEVISNEQFDFKVMLGAYIIAEVNNPNCPWETTELPNNELVKNKGLNEKRIKRLIALANQYPDIINSLSVGNEATVDWTDHLVPVNSVIAYARMVKDGANQPVTFCENYVPWLDKLEPLVQEIDFISIHSYPVWEYKSIEEGIQVTKQNYEAVSRKYPNTPVVITEAGWATQSNGRGIEPSNVNESLQKRYISDLLNWTNDAQIIAFVFEAFDENWKGSDEPGEPEKHWGLYRVDRTPKLVVGHL